MDVGDRPLRQEDAVAVVRSRDRAAHDVVSDVDRVGRAERRDRPDEKRDGCLSPVLRHLPAEVWRRDVWGDALERRDTVDVEQVAERRHRRRSDCDSCQRRDGRKRDQQPPDVAGANAGKDGRVERRRVGVELACN